MATAGIYTRISEDTEGESLGVERQHEDALTILDENGIDAATELYTDNNRSASSYARKNRPEFDRMLDDARAGKLDGIVVYDLDRLTRVPRVGEDIIDLAEGMTVLDGTGVFDLTTPEGRHRFRNAINNAALESDKTSKRLKRQKLQLADKGKRSGGARPFGYDLVPKDERKAKGYDGPVMTIRESEAELVRKAARDILAGGSLTGVAREWNRLDVPRPQGGKAWSVQNVRAVLVNPDKAGLRAHRGEVVGDASWPAIIDRDTHDLLVAQLTRRRGQVPSRPTLLAGLVFCDRCKGLMTRDKDKGVPVFRCRKGEDERGCGRCWVRAEPVEREVIDTVLVAFDDAAEGRIENVSPRLARVLGYDDDADERKAVEAEINRLEAKLIMYGDMLEKDEVDRAEYVRRTGNVRADLADVNRKRLATARRERVIEDPGSLHASWDKLPDDRKRAVVGLVIRRVVIAPRGPKASSGWVRDLSTPEGRVSVDWAA
jgi:site-specific DNA recombinase